MVFSLFLRRMKRARNKLYLWGGLFFTGLGIAGIILPLMPGTVFLLIAASLFVRSSEKWHSWLVNHPVWGETVRDFQAHKTVSSQTKFLILGVMWSSLAFSIYLVEMLWMDGLLMSVGTSITYFIHSLKTR